MDWKGTGNRLSEQDYRAIASEYGLEVAHVRAVVEVETNGSGFDSRRRVKILYEPHIMWRELKTEKARTEAARRGVVVYQKQGTKPYPRSMDEQYARLEAAMAVNERAALNSCSWGLGQIMGFNAQAAGYSSAADMVEDFKTGERAQLRAMMRLAATWGLIEALRQRDWARFARRWNGAGYKKNRYDAKLQAAYDKWSRASSGTVLQVGSRGARVRLLQELLAERGYTPGRIDGSFGPSTRAAVLAWKADNGRPLTVEVTEADMAALEESAERPRPDRSDVPVKEIEERSPAAADAKDVIKTAGTVAVAVSGTEVADRSSLTDQLRDLAEHSQTLTTAVETVEHVLRFVADHSMILLALALGYVIYKNWHARREEVRSYREGEWS